MFQQNIKIKYENMKLILFLELSGKKKPNHGHLYILCSNDVLLLCPFIQIKCVYKLYFHISKNVEMIHFALVRL